MHGCWGCVGLQEIRLQSRQLRGQERSRAQRLLQPIRCMGPNPAYAHFSVRTHWALSDERSRVLARESQLPRRFASLLFGRRAAVPEKFYRNDDLVHLPPCWLACQSNMPDVH